MADEEGKESSEKAGLETTLSESTSLTGSSPDGETQRSEAKTEVKTELQEKKLKKAFLEKFGFRKKVKTGDGAGSADAGDATGSPEVIAETLYKELSTIKGNDFIVLRVSKKVFVTILGVLVMAMWLVFLGRMGIERFKPEWAFWNRAVMEQAKNEQLMPVSTASAEAAVRVRVRDNSGVAGAGQTLVDYLIQTGYTSIELADDEGSDYSGLMVVVKPNQNALREKIEDVLNQRYVTSSPSAELTVDSDFDAVILFGEGVEVVATAGATVAPTTAPTLTPTPTASAGATLE